MLIILIIAFGCLLLDQITKMAIVANFDLYEYKTIIDGFFDLFYVRNDGFAWGMDAKLWILILITFVALGVFVYLGLKVDYKKDKWFAFTLGFMLGGTLGNFVDRLFQSDHTVIDFLSFILYYPWIDNGLVLKTYDFPVFNVADSFLVVGAIMFIIYILFIEPKKEINKENDTNDEVVKVE